MNIVTTKDIITTLKEVGFTEYEAKIYISLLQNHPANGNSIATFSGVPTPKVYESLRRMEVKGFVFIISGGDNGKQVRYSPLPYEKLLKNKKVAFLGQMEFLEDSLSKVSSQSNTDWTELFVVKGYSTSMEFISSAISDSQSEILLSCWKNELEFLKTALVEAADRGIYIVTMVFDDIYENLPWKNFKHYSVNHTLNRHIGELSIVIDNSKTILFHGLNDSPHAVVSSHPSTVSVTRNYIRHDIYVNRILGDFRKTIIDHYGKNLEHLINDF